MYVSAAYILVQDLFLNIWGKYFAMPSCHLTMKKYDGGVDAEVEAFKLTWRSTVSFMLLYFEVFQYGVCLC
jgi:hypothetical protein